MYLDETFDDVVLFDIPSHAALLCEQFRKDRLAWMEIRDDTAFVAAALRGDCGDLAVLLRAVASWMVDERVAHLRFEVDGRSYTLLEPSVLLAPAL